MRYHLIFIWWQLWKSQKINAEKRPLHIIEIILDSIATVENSVEGPKKNERKSSNDPSIPFLNTYPTRVKSLPLESYFCHHVHWSIIRNDQDMATSEVSTHKGTDKDTFKSPWKIEIRRIYFHAKTFDIHE